MGGQEAKRTPTDDGPVLSSASTARIAFPCPVAPGPCKAVTGRKLSIFKARIMRLDLESMITKGRSMDKQFQLFQTAFQK
jgi:hypothetical protein